MRGHEREGSPVNPYLRGEGSRSTPQRRSRAVGSGVGQRNPTNTQPMVNGKLALTPEEAEECKQLVNDNARMIYFYIRTRWGYDHVKAMNQLREYARKGEIPGAGGRGAPTNSELRRLFKLPPLVGPIR